ncbi:MAG TPA: HAMP domain-containing sensor histidine kinase [Candidatus Binatia bacterium]
MSNKSLLERSSAHANAGVMSGWRDLWRSRGGDRTSLQNDKNAIVAIQWLVAIGTSYLLFAVHDLSLTSPLRAFLILLCLISAAVVQRIPDQIFDRRIIEPALLVIDSILIISAITLSQETPWDLLLLFFFCVFIAVIGETLLQVAVACLLLSLVFVLFASPHTVDITATDPSFFIRIPFMFGISIFYGHLASQVKRDKKQMEKLEETIRLKRQFVCALAHDIKTPLNVILGHAELLAEEPGSPTSPAAKRFSIKCIRKNIDGIVKLITDFLAVSKLETLKLDSAKSLVQLNAIAEDVVLGQMVTARDKNLSLTHDLDKKLKPMLGDADQMQRALGNLVGNAIKFTRPGGTITVSSRMIKNHISIKVTDTGCGIPKEELAGLFTEYKRLKGAANTEGTGLGLFIVKTIVEAHDGTVTVESEEGVGTTFTVLLPSSKDSWNSIEPATAAHGAKTVASEYHNSAQPLAEEQPGIQ